MPVCPRLGVGHNNNNNNNNTRLKAGIRTRQCFHVLRCVPSMCGSCLCWSRPKQILQIDTKMYLIKNLQISMVSLIFKRRRTQTKVCLRAAHGSCQCAGVVGNEASARNLSIETTSLRTVTIVQYNFWDPHFPKFTCFDEGSPKDESLQVASFPFQ